MTSVNPLLAETVESLPLGTALDLGCGPGDDTRWLAHRGWQITAVDISATAIQRLRESTRQLNLAQLITVEQHDLTATFPPGEFDLVSAQYFHGRFTVPRSRILRRAADRVRPGGVMLIVDHGSIAPWSWDQNPGIHFPTPDEIAVELDLDPSDWQVIRADKPSREATGPDGSTATVVDHVLAVRRNTAERS
ncbi:class I SAM-dependent methyltransferase [Kribbella sp. NBC_01505]|uniref:class I SAM-dependent methyltransferase n=1 Tax=Kribbella sp. NBC_01505 TaxID=2903580 RepID=UPI00386ADBE6